MTLLDELSRWSRERLVRLLTVPPDLRAAKDLRDRATGAARRAPAATPRLASLPDIALDAGDVEVDVDRLLTA